MTDLTPILNELLKSHDARPTIDPSLALQNIDEFLKEAYRINAHIASLNTYLKGIRQAYLSTAPPPRRTGASSKDKQSKYFTDRDREKIDAETQLLIRQLKASIQNLSDAETLRQDTERSLQQRKYARLGLGALGSWASGGIGPKKSFEQTLDESRTNTITQHREAVIWYLNEKLHRCTMIQAGMMEKRLSREMEKNKSALANSRGPMPALGGFDNAPAPPTKYSASTAAHVETQQMYPEEELTPEQIQMFEKENQDMLKHYQTTLDQVRTAEKSLIEIAELQTQLVSNLDTQSAHIDQLVADSLYTAENVGGGNKQLKKATERKSTAKYVFYASCGLSLFLVAWDLII